MPCGMLFIELNDITPSCVYAKLTANYQIDLTNDY